jgi:hypothetical protein
MLEHYALHYIKKSEGKLVRYPQLKEHFRNWATINIGEENCFKNKCLNLLYAYIRKNYKCNTEHIFDIEIIENNDNYKINYNIIEHYPENLKTLYQLIKQCHVVIGKTKIPLHKYMESKN